MAKTRRTEGGSLDAPWGKTGVIWSSLSKGGVGLSLCFRKKLPGCWMVEGREQGQEQKGWLVGMLPGCLD